MLSLAPLRRAVARGLPRMSSAASTSALAATVATVALSALTFAPAAQAQAAGGTAIAHPHVLLHTSDGDITLELYPEKAPKTVANFLAYVKEGHYGGTIFHRVIPGFMIQGGGYDANMKERATHAPIPLEAQSGLHNQVGTIAMARTSDPNSATSQFFINTVDNPNLDYPHPDGNGYAVFGRVTAGMDVVKKIEATPTTSTGMMQDVPRTPVLIESAKVE
ncbi:peptidylprolyl isomerase [Robbsia sp. KACC 23696]|uniref:peptidylprolyl isomerase n=1 Tax=Robbsia sp. KACC 23696 TaxID=3149231 RepID=UPI00325ABF1B